jgi:hypothetical protein
MGVADRLLPFSAVVKNAWSYASIPYTSAWRGAYLSIKITLHSSCGQQWMLCA